MVYTGWRRWGRWPPLRVMDHFDEFLVKMRGAGVGKAPIAAFRRQYQALVNEESGLIAESTIEPAEGVAQFTGEPERARWDAELLARTVVIKLNGGLGTGMGLRLTTRSVSMSRSGFANRASRCKVWNSVA